MQEWDALIDYGVSLLSQDEFPENSFLTRGKKTYHGSLSIVLGYKSYAILQKSGEHRSSQFSLTLQVQLEIQFI